MKKKHIEEQAAEFAKVFLYWFIYKNKTTK